MIDIFNLLNNDSNIDIFTSNGVNLSWQTWNKPRNAKFVQILTIGAGGGGGAGWSSSSNSGGGGGGGGSGAVSSAIYPSNFLPDRLYIQVGVGGIGGVLRTDAGGNGGRTYVAITNTVISAITVNESILIANGGNGGVAGTGSVAGTGGAAGTINTNTLLGKLGITSYYAGQIGAAGGAVTPTAGVSVTIANIVTGGAGGGANNLSSTGSNGGNITGAGLVPLISGSPTIAGAVADGSSGYSSLPSINSSARTPLFFTGGAGGGSNTSSSTGRGGNGGYGAIGCGGGGGGASNFSTTANGKGGNGGDGLVVITSW